MNINIKKIKREVLGAVFCILTRLDRLISTELEFKRYIPYFSDYITFYLRQRQKRKHKNCEITYFIAWSKFYDTQQ